MLVGIKFGLMRYTKTDFVLIYSSSQVGWDRLAQRDTESSYKNLIL